MKYLALIMAVLCAVSCTEDYLLFQEFTLDPDHILGTWYHTFSVPLPSNPQYSRIDTTIRIITRLGPLSTDSIEIISEYHRADEVYDPMIHSQISTRLQYTSGKGSRELQYEDWRFTMPEYDSLILYTPSGTYRTKRRE